MPQKPRKNKALRELNDQWLKSRSVDDSAPVILIAEDSEADVYFLLRSLDKCGVRNPIVITRTGTEALELLQRGEGFNHTEAGPVVFLDMYMPGMSGFEILEWKGTEEAYPRGLFVALSNSDRVKDINRAYELGAKTFLAKPMDRADLVNLINAFEGFWSMENNPEAGEERPQESNSNNRGSRRDEGGRARDGR